MGGYKAPVLPDKLIQQIKRTASILSVARCHGGIKMKNKTGNVLRTVGLEPTLFHLMGVMSSHYSTPRHTRASHLTQIGKKGDLNNRKISSHQLRLTKWVLSSIRLPSQSRYSTMCPSFWELIRLPSLYSILSVSQQHPCS